MVRGWGIGDGDGLRRTGMCVGEREADACAGQGQRLFKDLENEAGRWGCPRRLLMDCQRQKTMSYSNLNGPT